MKKSRAYPKQYATNFEKEFTAWKDTWLSGGCGHQFRPAYALALPAKSMTHGLLALGQAVLPLVVEALADPENFIALQLYDAMQPNERLIVQYEPDDERILEGEQGRARRVVQAWFANR